MYHFHFPLVVALASMCSSSGFLDFLPAGTKRRWSRERSLLRCRVGESPALREHCLLPEGVSISVSFFTPGWTLLEQYLSGPLAILINSTTSGERTVMGRPWGEVFRRRLYGRPQRVVSRAAFEPAWKCMRPACSSSAHLFLQLSLIPSAFQQPLLRSYPQEVSPS